MLPYRFGALGGNAFPSLDISFINQTVKIMTNAYSPAHPAPEGLHNTGDFGLTKREYFAGLAMQGLLANTDITELFKGNNGEPITSVIAEVSVRLSDALLTEFSKPK